jgi:hypothetical protein
MSLVFCCAVRRSGRRRRIISIGRGRGDRQECLSYEILRACTGDTRVARLAGMNTGGQCHDTEKYTESGSNAEFLNALADDEGER